MQTGDTLYCVLESLASKSGFASVRQKRQPGELKSASLFPENTQELLVPTMQPAKNRQRRTKSNGSICRALSPPMHCQNFQSAPASVRRPFSLPTLYVGTFCTFMLIAGTRALCTLGFLISHEKEKGSSAARLITRIRRQNERHFLERKKSLRSPTETAFARLKVGPLTQMHASYRFLSLAQLWSPWEGRRETG